MYLYLNFIQLGLKTAVQPRIDNETLTIEGEVYPDANAPGDEEQLEHEMEIEEFCFGGWGWCPSMPATMHMVYTAGYDDNFLQKTGSRSAAESLIKQAMTHAAPAFCAPGLGTKISIQVSTCQ